MCNLPNSPSSPYLKTIMLIRFDFVSYYFLALLKFYFYFFQIIFYIYVWFLPSCYQHTCTRIKNLLLSLLKSFFKWKNFHFNNLTFEIYSTFTFLSIFNCSTCDFNKSALNIIIFRKFCSLFVIYFGKEFMIWRRKVRD